MSQQILIVVLVLLSVAFFTLMERKVLSYVHFRKGPNKISINGILQPFADAIKLLTKDDAPVKWSNNFMFYFAPLLMMSISLCIWSVWPLSWGVGNSMYSFLTMYILYGMLVYGLMWSGWSSNSTYSMVGAIRAVSQSISYEVVFSFVVLCIMITLSGYSLSLIHEWKWMWMSLMSPSLFALSWVIILVEMGRTPFDLPEGESELVSGYSVEYGGSSFIFIFLSENTMIFFSCFVFTFFFLSSLSSSLEYIIYSLVITMVVVVRGVLPRIRYDMLMSLCWKILTPLILLNFNFIYLMKNLSF